MSPFRDEQRDKGTEAWPPAPPGLLRVLAIPRFVYRMARRALESLLYERRLGVETAPPRTASDVPPKSERVAYHPSRWRHLHRVLRDETIEPTDVFLDLGAGLGRAVIQAVQLPFERVIGVEIEPGLSAVASSNLEQVRSRWQCRNAEIVTADASTFQIPDDVTVIYLYNPFTGSVFQRVVDNVLASLRRNPRQVRIVYTNPVEEARLLAAGARLRRTIRRWRPSAEWARREETRIYSLAPKASVEPQASSEELVVRRALPGDQRDIRRLGATVFDTERSDALWRWHFEQSPLGPAAIYVLTHGQRVVGHHAHTPCEAWVDGVRLRLALSHELMIDPAYRGRGGTIRLASAFLADGEFDLRIGFPYDHSAALLERAEVGRTIGQLPRWVHPLGPDPEESRARAIALTLARAHARTVSAYAGSLTLEPVDVPGMDVDELAQRSAAFARCIRVRDAAYVRWRWLDEPATQAQLVAARSSDGELRGFIAYDIASDQGNRRGRILDLLAADFRSTRALLVDATRFARARGARRVECLYQDPRPWARAALVSAGFFPARAELNVLCGSLGSDAGCAPLSLDSWYLTYGDVDFDATAAQPTATAASSAPRIAA